MTTHLLKAGPISTLSTRCGVLGAKAKKSDKIGTEDGLPFIDCAGCLRELIVETRIKASGLKDCPETRWFFGGDTGNSSATIWSVMTRWRPATFSPRREDVPHDPADFGRCVRLLVQFPAWRARMPEVAALHPEWGGLVAEWDALTALYLEELPTGTAPKLYARMKALGL